MKRTAYAVAANLLLCPFALAISSQGEGPTLDQAGTLNHESSRGDDLAVLADGLVLSNSEDSGGAFPVFGLTTKDGTVDLIAAQRFVDEETYLEKLYGSPYLLAPVGPVDEGGNNAASEGIRVPDGSTTISLLGISLAGLLMWARRKGA